MILETLMGLVTDEVERVVQQVGEPDSFLLESGVGVPEDQGDVRPATRLSPLVAGVRTAVETQADWAETAQLVADQLRRHLPTPDVLTAAQRLGSPDDYCGFNLDVESDGSFSIVALVWRPGQTTRIHDHVTWCVFGVIQGVEHEELFDPDLNLVGRSENHVGDVSGFAPPGDIHRVRNTSETTAISIHIYGTDITRIGSGARRYYN